MVEKIMTSSGTAPLSPDAELGGDIVIHTIIKQKKKKEKNTMGDDVPHAYVYQALSLLQDKPLNVHRGHDVSGHGVSYTLEAGKHLARTNDASAFDAIGRHKAQQRSLIIGNRAAGDAEITTSARHLPGRTAEDATRLHSVRQELTLQGKIHVTEMQTARLAEHADSRHPTLRLPSSPHEEMTSATPGLSQLQPAMSDAMSSSQMPPSTRGKPSTFPSLSVTQQERQNGLSALAMADGHTVRLSYPFQHGAGSHHVNVALHRHSQQEGSVMLLPSDMRTAEALLRQMGDWPARLPDAVYPERGDKEREGRQQQDEQEEEQE